MCVSVPPKVIFEPSLEGFVFLFTERAVVSRGRIEEFQKAAETGEMGLFDRIAFKSGQQITGPSDYVFRLQQLGDHRRPVDADLGGPGLFRGLRL